MSRPNVYGLPQHLRKDVGGYFLDYFVQEEGTQKRKRVRIGQVPLSQAKKVLARHMQDIVERKFISTDGPKALFFDAADAYLAVSMARKKSHRNDEMIVPQFKAYFGNRPLESFTADLVEAYLLQRKKDGQRRHKGKPLTGTTLNKEIASLKTIFKRALVNGQIDRNPILGVKRYKEFSRDRTLGPGEYQALLAQCQPHVRDIVQLAHSTGMRCGEILGLRWDQVDLKNGVLILEAEDTKTQEKREIPLSGTLVELFRRTPRTLGSPHVFTWKGKRIGSVKTAFYGACRRTGIEDFHFHDLRHCAITNYRKAGVPDNVIMSISGHKTHSVFKRYDRVDRGDRLAALRKMESLIDTDMTAVENQASQ